MLDLARAVVLLGLVLAVVWLTRACLARRDATRRRQLLEESRQSSRDSMRQERWTDAIAALQKAIELAGDDPQTKSEFFFDQAYAFEQLRDQEHALAAYDKVRQTEQEINPPRRRHLAAFRQGLVLVQQQRWIEAEDCLTRSARDAELVQRPSLQLNALRLLLGVYQSLRRPLDVVSHARRVADLAHSLGDETTVALALDLEGDALAALGHSRAALDRYERSLDLFAKLENTGACDVVTHDIGRLYQTLGQWEEAERWLGVCLREQRAHGDVLAQARTAYDLACVNIHMAEFGAALGYLQFSMGSFRKAEDRAGADLVGRTLLGLGVLIHREATADRLTFADIERGSAKLKSGQ